MSGDGMPRSANVRPVGKITQTTTSQCLQEQREDAAASPRLSDDAKLAVKRHREERADALAATCATQDSKIPPSEVLGNFVVSDF